MCVYVCVYVLGRYSILREALGNNHQSWSWRTRVMQRPDPASGKAFLPSCQHCRWTMLPLTAAAFNCQPLQGLPQPKRHLIQGPAVLGAPRSMMDRGTCIKTQAAISDPSFPTGRHSDLHLHCPSCFLPDPFPRQRLIPRASLINTGHTKLSQSLLPGDLNL